MSERINRKVSILVLLYGTSGCYVTCVAVYFLLWTLAISNKHFYPSNNYGLNLLHGCTLYPFKGVHIYNSFKAWLFVLYGI